jgi:hypothetical protein
MTPAAVFQAGYSLPKVSNPGMITPDEEQLYFHLARTFWLPERFYLEFGTWLGRSTTRICQGFDASGAKDWQLYCYDLFRWHAQHVPKAERGGMPAAVANLKDGDSFEDAFLSLMGPYRERIKTFRGQVTEAPDVLAGAFSPDAKLGVLFVDASKGWDNGRLLQAVAPNLALGTRIVFQDFLMNSAVFLQLLVMSLSQLEPETVVANGGSFVVKVVGPVRQDEPLFDQKSIKSISVDAIFAACERLQACLPTAVYEAAALGTTLPILLWKRGFEEESHRAASNLRLSAEQQAMLIRRMPKQPILSVPPLAARLAKA